MNQNFTEPWQGLKIVVGIPFSYIWILQPECQLFILLVVNGCNTESETIKRKSRRFLVYVQARYLPKICIKYRKHWKSYESFQPSGQIWQIGLMLAAIYYSPNWQQFVHIRPMTIIKSIFKKILKSKKVGLPRFQTKNGMLLLIND